MSIQLPELATKYHADAVPYSYIRRSRILYTECKKNIALGVYPCYIRISIHDSNIILDPILKRLIEAGFMAKIIMNSYFDEIDGEYFESWIMIDKRSDEQ